MAKVNQTQNSVNTPKKDKRNLKYGSLSIAVTAVFVALVIVLNIIVTSLSSVYGFYTDMTASGFYSLSEAFETEMNRLLKPEDGEEVHINIVLMCEEDFFSVYGTYAPTIYRTLKELTKEFDNINLVAYNTTVHPELAEKYKTTALDTPALDDIIFELCDENGNPLEGTPAKKYTAASFFVSDSESGSLIGYKAEERILSAIALLTGKVDRPIAYYLQGHGEPTLEEAPEWEEVLSLAGFEVKPINLTTDDLANVNSDDNLVIINCPKYDLTSAEGLSEVKKLRAFLGTNYGNLIVVEDASIPKLPALEGLLSEWGLGFGSSVTDDAHSVSASGAGKIFADYTQTYVVKSGADTQSMETQILSKIFGNSTKNLPNTVFSTPKEVIISDKSNVVSGMNASKSIFSLLKTYDTAMTKAADGTQKQGSVTMLGVSRMIWEVNSDEISYAIALGSADFLSGDYANSCANRDVMFELLNLIWDRTVSFKDIDYKEFDDTALTDVSTAAANTWTITCVAVIPIIIAGLGVIVYVRRRHS